MGFLVISVVGTEVRIFGLEFWRCESSGDSDCIETVVVCEGCERSADSGNRISWFQRSGLVYLANQMFMLLGFEGWVRCLIRRILKSLSLRENLAGCLQLGWNMTHLNGCRPPSQIISDSFANPASSKSSS